MMKRAILLALALCALPAFGHDFWLQPSTFRPAPGTDVDVRFLQGDRFNGEAVARNEARIERFLIRDAAGEREVGGENGADPAGHFIASSPGLAIVGYRTKPKQNEPMEAGPFEAYLREEGLEQVIGMRAARGDAKKRGTEIFSRSAKALLHAGGTSRTSVDEPLGFRFEIVPETLPESKLTVRLLFEGKPVRGVLVTALHGEDESVTASARSDAKGRVTLPLAKDGFWMIKAVHMVPAAPAAGVDWESIWATLTFER
jgi:uncharacterized GH25 family protein